MNLGEAKTIVRQMMGVKDTSVGAYTDPIVTAFLNMACRQIWKRAVAMGVGAGTAVTDVITYTAGTPIDLDTELTGVPLRVEGVYDTDSSDAVPGMDDWRQLVPRAFNEIVDAADGYYCIHGNQLILPESSSPEKVIVVSIQELAALSLDADDLLGGVLTQLHDLVVFRTVVLLTAKQREANRIFVSLEQDEWASVRRILRLQKQEPAMVRYIERGD